MTDKPTNNPIFLRHAVIEKGIRGTSISLIGFWLLALYFVLLWLVVGSLSAHGFQDRIEAMSRKAAEAITLSGIIDYSTMTGNLLQIGNDLQTLSADLEETETQKERRSNLDNILEEQSFQQRKALALKLPELGVGEPSDEHLATAVAQASNASIEDEWNAYKQAVADESDNKKQWGNLKERAKGLKKQAEEKEERKTQLEAKLKGFKDRGSYEILAGEFAFFDHLKAQWLASMPNHILVLILTMSMGGLGSLIYITRYYFRTDVLSDAEGERQTSASFSWYLFRPFLGMAIALAIYILARAGQLTIAEGDLSPYFISFLAIISGLLSEQAAERIRSAGTALFRGEQTEIELKAAHRRDRWGVRLEKAIEDQGKKREDLTGFLDADAATVEDWIVGKKSVPYEEQRIIASWLAVPKRELFTDLAPAPGSARNEDTT